MSRDSTPFMELALKEAEAAGARGEIPVGAVLVRDGEVIAAAGNRTRELADVTAHAEVLAIRDGANASLASERLADCDLYVTLEPCTLCAAAISFARIRRLYYGAADPKGGGGRARRSLLSRAHLPPCARGLLRYRRDGGGGASSPFLPRPALKTAAARTAC